MQDFFNIWKFGFEKSALHFCKRWHIQERIKKGRRTLPDSRRIKKDQNWQLTFQWKWKNLQKCKNSFKKAKFVWFGIQKGQMATPSLNRNISKLILGRKKCKRKLIFFLNRNFYGWCCHYRCQCHQHFSPAFCRQYFVAKNYKVPRRAFIWNFGIKNVLLYKKRKRKTLMKLTIACTACVPAANESPPRTWLRRGEFEQGGLCSGQADHCIFLTIHLAMK